MLLRVSLLALLLSQFVWANDLPSTPSDPEGINCRAVLQVASPLLENYPVKEFKAIRGQGEHRQTAPYFKPTDEAAKALLLDMEATILSWRELRDLSPDQVTELTQFLRASGPDWVMENFHAFRQAGGDLALFTATFCEQAIIDQSKIRGIPWMARIQEKLQVFSPRNIPKLVLAGVSGVTRWTLHNVKTMVVMGTLLGLWNNYFNPIQGTLFNYAAQKGSQHLGSTSAHLQRGLDQWNAVKHESLAMHSLSDQLRRFDYEHMTSAQAHQLWSEYEEKFQLLSIRNQQVLPATQRDGRAILQKFVFETPVIMAGSLSSSEVQFSFHRKEFESLQAQIGTQTPTAAQAERLEYHRAMMELSENSIASTLAAWKVTEFIYPEVAREPANEASAKSLTDGYRRFTGSMKFNVYLKYFSRQMDDTLRKLDLGISLGELNPNGIRQP